MGTHYLETLPSTLEASGSHSSSTRQHEAPLWKMSESDRPRLQLPARSFPSSSQEGSEDGSPASWERQDQWGEASGAPSANKRLDKAFWGPLATRGMDREVGEGRGNGRWMEDLCFLRGHRGRPQVAHTKLVPQVRQQWKKLWASFRPTRKSCPQQLLPFPDRAGF